MKEQFSTLHDIIKDSTLMPYHSKEPMDGLTTVRVPYDRLAKVHEILKGNSTNLSRFINQCCITLVKEYTSVQEG